MSKYKKDIKDSEIRIIGSSNPGRRPRKRVWMMLLPGLAAALALIGYMVFYSTGRATEYGDDGPADQKTETAAKEVYSTISPAEISEPGYVTRVDTAVNGIELVMLFPHNSQPVLEVGSACLNDSSVILTMQAADIRGDNGEIVGAFVKEGELISKGKSKAGFCAIIEGETIIGTAINTAYLEKALDNGGYFFRQYPLVVEGQPIENKPKGRALRKALAEVDGRICVILSEQRLSFTDFAQTLADLGVRNAIYLVGAASYGMYVDARGERTGFGKRAYNTYPNINYIVWRK